ncbi:MAG: hypothetical protein S4CHLAM37_12280 [Chlamydiia bacterium]|nr:hypothetical protein [Chlamydiia bacterium]
MLLKSLKESFDKEVHKLDPSMQTAFTAFEKMGLPSKKSDAFRYLGLKNLYEMSFSKASNIQEEESPANTLVFVDGVLQKSKQIESSIVVSTIKDAIKSHGALIRSRFSRFVKAEKDPLALLNHALFSSGGFVYIPPDLQMKEPLNIVFKIKEEQSLHIPKLMVFLGKGSSLQINLKIVCENASMQFSNRYIEIHQEMNSVCSMINYLEESENLYHFDSVRSFVKRDAKFNYLSVSANSPTQRQNLEVSLLEEGADTNIKGLCFLDDKAESHAHVTVKHLEESCTSHQHFKSVQLGSSKSSFEGKIFVDQKAQKTLAYQMSSSLLLSDKAHTFCKPNLEIYADDVKASHGATISQLNENELFYLKSRGLPYKDCCNLLIKGFCKDILDDIVDPLMIERLLKKISIFLANEGQLNG